MVHQWKHKKQDFSVTQNKRPKRRLINGEMHSTIDKYWIANSLLLRILRLSLLKFRLEGGAHDDVVTRKPGKSDFRLMMGGSIMTRRISWLVVSFYVASRINFLSSFLSAFRCLKLNTQMSAFTPPSPPRRLLKAAVKDVRTDSVGQDLSPSLRLNDLFPCIVFISLIRIGVVEAFPLTRNAVKWRSCAVFPRVRASSPDQLLSYTTMS